MAKAVKQFSRQGQGHSEHLFAVFCLSFLSFLNRAICRARTTSQTSMQHCALLEQSVGLGQSTESTRLSSKLVNTCDLKCSAPMPAHHTCTTQVVRHRYRPHASTATGPFELKATSKQAQHEHRARAMLLAFEALSRWAVGRCRANARRVRQSSSVVVSFSVCASFSPSTGLVSCSCDADAAVGIVGRPVLESTSADHVSPHIRSHLKLHPRERVVCPSARDGGDLRLQC